MKDTKEELKREFMNKFTVWNDKCRLATLCRPLRRSQNPKSRWYQVEDARRSRISTWRTV